MPTYLPVPADWGRSPDGKGWNRLSLNAHIGTPAGRCSLVPITASAYWETMNRRPCAEWGSCYGRCPRSPTWLGGPWPDCSTCPIQGRRTHLEAFDPRVLVRYFPERGHPDQQAETAHLMNRPDDFDSRSQWWTWADLAALEGWVFDGTHVDEFSRGYWIRCVWPPTDRGVYGRKGAVR
ncbi:hypothetical protein GCM10022254_09690 [Actinomadura meridiana]|uniref:Uncharacterized protein n=1 Tax=Actinomadura meridiana TaxID=559626 RepID=A0ABP8BV28_9ACTN